MAARRSRRRAETAFSLTFNCPICEKRFPASRYVDADALEKAMTTHVVQCSASSRSVPSPATGSLGSPASGSSSPALQLDEQKRNMQATNEKSNRQATETDTSSTSARVEGVASESTMIAGKSTTTCTAKLDPVRTSNVKVSPFSPQQRAESASPAPPVGSQERKKQATNEKSNRQRTETDTSSTPVRAEGAVAASAMIAGSTDTCTAKLNPLRTGNVKVSPFSPQQRAEIASPFSPVQERKKKKTSGGSEAAMGTGSTFFTREMEADLAKGWNVKAHKGLGDVQKSTTSKVEPDKAVIATRSGLTLVAIDPGHLLSKTWWRKKEKKRTASSKRPAKTRTAESVQFDIEELMVCEEDVAKNPSSSTDCRDGGEVVEGAEPPLRESKRLKSKKKTSDELKLRCPVCQRIFSPIWMDMSMESMSQHVARCQKRKSGEPSNGLPNLVNVDTVSNDSSVSELSGSSRRSVRGLPVAIKRQTVPSSVIRRNAALDASARAEHANSLRCFLLEGATKLALGQMVMRGFENNAK